jgi:hypothetical protein
MRKFSKPGRFTRAMADLHENKPRRAGSLLLAALASLILSGCAGMSASDNAGQECVGPVSFCNPFFGS